MVERFEGTSNYIATEDLKVAVNAAVTLRRPLLVKGEPGTGKTVLAHALDLVAAFVEAARTPHDPIGLYRALRRFAGVQETLYPLAPVFEAVSRWFLTPDRRHDPERHRSLAAVERAERDSLQ